MHNNKKIIYLCIILSILLNVNDIAAMQMEGVSEDTAKIISENAPSVSQNAEEDTSENIVDSQGPEDIVSQDTVPQDTVSQDDLITGGISDNMVHTEEEDNASSVPEDFIYCEPTSMDEDGHLKMVLGRYTDISFVCINNTDATLKGTVSSKNNNIVEIDSDSKNFTVSPLGFFLIDIGFHAKKLGTTDIIVTMNGEKYQYKMIVVPPSIEITDITQTAYQTLKLSWEKVAGCSGYYIERSVPDQDEYHVIKTVKDGNITSASINAEWGKKYRYRIVGFIIDNGRNYRGQDSYHTELYTADRMGTSITSVKKSGASSLKITWKKLNAATGYELYRSVKENGNYKKIYTAKKGTVTSYKQKVKKGIAYYYKLVTITAAGKSLASPTISQLIPKSSKKKTKSVKITQQYNDAIYYYESGGKLHIVQKGKNLKIYTMTAAMKIKSTKTVKLGKYDKWGGFYHGIDGKFYVAVGYRNPKESKKKTVIKVIQYSSNWKKQKTAAIKGSAANVFEGIYEPFRSGSCRMDMQGNTLYVHTSRTMFILDDGLHHQSNISFAIDTKTMKANTSNDCYVSHSFDQYVRFKDGSLYLLDHGDAFPRGINLTTVKKFGTADAVKNEYEIFGFKGELGDNYTGCDIGGMEIGSKNILTTGTAQPHNYKVKGVTGFGSQYTSNLYLTVTDKETGKNTVKWLTKYNPRSKKIQIKTSKILKLSDDRFAILYSFIKGKKTTLKYIVVDGNGKKVYAKKYANIDLYGDHQPILINGNIMWLQNGMLYSIPAVY